MISKQMYEKKKQTNKKEEDEMWFRFDESTMTLIILMN